MEATREGHPRLQAFFCWTRGTRGMQPFLHQAPDAPKIGEVSLGSRTEVAHALSEEMTERIRRLQKRGEQVPWAELERAYPPPPMPE